MRGRSATSSRSPQWVRLARALRLYREDARDRTSGERATGGVSLQLQPVGLMEQQSLTCYKNQNTSFSHDVMFD